MPADMMLFANMGLEISSQAVSRLALLFDDVFAHKSRGPASNGVKKEAEENTALEME